MENRNDVRYAALRYAEVGYPVFPCAPGTKTPLTEHGHLDATTDPGQLEAWWTERPSANVAIATGGLVVIDVDAESTWLADDPDRQLELASGPLALTANGGRHYIFRQPAGRHWRNTTGRIAPHVDTRADGGYVVVSPSVLAGGKAYRWAEGMALDDPPEKLPEPPPWLSEWLDTLATSRQTACGGPTFADVAAGPPEANKIPSGQRNATLARLAGTMRRVGMSQSEILAALQRANAERCVPSLGDREVRRIASSIARYPPDEVSVALVENHFVQDFGTEQTENEQNAVPALIDPGPLPEALLRVPGFIAAVMEHCLATSPYPNRALAFCGALALQAFLAGRKVRDEADNRTNLYLLALAFSAVGKDWPRKVNTAILHRVGLVNALGEKFASGEGIQDALFMNPSLLFQTDEIDGLLQSINKARDARHENILGTLLTMYSSANSIYPMRRKAGREPPGVIDQPCLVVYGTAIPTHYYSALSERMLTNGFFARMLIVESGRRSVGQDPGIIDPPSHVIETAQWWADFRPGTGNLENWHPQSKVVPATEPARQLLTDSRLQAESEYTQAEARGDPVGTTVWGRVHEQIRKLALLYSVSENHINPAVSVDAVRWATDFVIHQTRRMLFMAQGHVADNPFHAECLRLVKKLRDAPNRTLPHQVLLKRMKMKAKDFRDLIETMIQRGDIESVAARTTGRSGIHYRFIGEGNAAGEEREGGCHE